MGSGCSLFSSDAAEVAAEGPLPPRQGGPLIGLPVFESTGLGGVDELFYAELEPFAAATAALHDSYASLRRDVQAAVGVLQGAFSVLLTPSPNTDVFTVEILRVDGSPLGPAEIAQLRGRDHSGKLRAADSALARALSSLADFFARASQAPSLGLSLSEDGTLVAKQQHQADQKQGRTPQRAQGQGQEQRQRNGDLGQGVTALPGPVVRFNQALMAMREALGGDYALALHLHKAQGHGAGAFRVQLVKPAPAGCGAGGGGLGGSSGGGSGAGCGVGGVGDGGEAGGGQQGAGCGWEVVTPMDVAGALNAERLQDALHACVHSNSRLAQNLAAAGIRKGEAVALSSPCSLALNPLPSPDQHPPHQPHPGSSAQQRHTHSRPLRHTDSSSTTTSNARSHARAAASTAAAAATAGAASTVAAALSDSRTRSALSRCLADLNGALYCLAGAAAAAAGPASAAALLTHVLSELRDMVAAAGGDAALAVYRPSVSFSRSPDLHLALALEARLEPGWGLQPFPDCLTPQVRRCWLLLQDLLRTHNATVQQLQQLRAVAAALEKKAMSRSASVPQEAAAAGLTLRQAAGAARAMVRNVAELQACCRGALDQLAAACGQVAEEVAEAAQLATLQCGLMSPLAWSLSLASTAVPGGGAAAAGSTASTTGTASAVRSLGAPGFGAAVDSNSSGLHSTGGSLATALALQQQQQQNLLLHSGTSACTDEGRRLKPEGGVPGPGALDQPSQAGSWGDGQLSSREDVHGRPDQAGGVRGGQGQGRGQGGARSESVKRRGAGEGGSGWVPIAEEEGRRGEGAGGQGGQARQREGESLTEAYARSALAHLEYELDDV